MNFNENLEKKNKINIFPTIKKKFSLKNGFANFFKLSKNILEFLSHFIVCIVCLGLKSEQNKDFENFIQHIDNPVFFSHLNQFIYIYI